MGRKPSPLEIRQIINDKDRAKIDRAIEARAVLDDAFPRQDFLTLEELGISCPTFLDDEAKKVWDGLASELGAFRLLKTVDVHLLARYCDAFVRWVSAKNFIEEHGVKYPVYTEERYKEFDEKEGAFITKIKRTLKSWQLFPEYKVYSDMSDKLLRLEQELGMTPIGRTKIAIAIASSKNNTPGEGDNGSVLVNAKQAALPVDPFDDL
jgi:P27 family predicted phage terminase small subunit